MLCHPTGYCSCVSNNAITFDLEAIRRANRGFKLLRFRAVAANTVTAAGSKVPISPISGC